MVHLTNYSQLRDDISSFNKEYSLNCVLEFDNNRLLPETKDGHIFLSKRNELLLLLENTYPYSRNIQELLFLYVAIDIQLFKEGSFENAHILLPLLEKKIYHCDKVLDGLEDFPEHLYVDFQMRALLRHELCHNRLSTDNEQKQQCIDEARKNILEWDKFPGVRGFLLRINQKKCLRDSSFLEENVCDAEAARWLAEYYKEGKMSYSEFDCICKQIVNSLYCRTFYGMVKIYNDFGIYGTNKAMLLYTVKNVIQVNFFSIELMESLKETLNDKELYKLVDNLNNEAKNFNLLLKTTTSSLKDLSVGYSLSYHESPMMFSQEEVNGMIQKYFMLGESLSSVLLKRLKV